MKETHYKLKHRVTALFAAAVMLCSMLPGAAFAEEPTPQPTEETVQMEQQTEPSETDNGQTDESSPDPGEDVTEATPETAEEQPAEEEIPAAVVGAELYTDLPDAPIGSYIGSEGLPVATGETKIGLGAWDTDLEQTNYLSTESLNSDNLTLAAPLLEDTNYAIVPILAQVEYPADGSSLDLVLPDGVTLLDYYGTPIENVESLLHNEYSETSAAVLGVYVQADADFTAQLVYTAPDGRALTKTLLVTIDRNATAEYPFPDSEIATFAERPTPAVTSGKITKVAKVNGTWLIWFNGEPAYCCTHGANGQPAGCPTYTYVNTSTVGADQCVPGDHYGNQIRIWGGLNQLALSDADDLPAVFSADAGEEISLFDFCASIYDDVQMYIIENFPESTAAEIYLASADELLNGVETYASARGYYTYIYNPGRAGWQTVALIGPEIGEEEPEPEPVVQEYYASWEAPAQTASGSFDFSYGIRTDKIQLKTQEKVDGATIEIEPITKSGSIDGGSWSVSPASKQTVTTSGHTADDNYQKNGGDAAASWSLHYAVTKSSGTRNGQVGPFTTQEAADAAANSARDAAIAKVDGAASSQSFEIVRSKDANADFTEQQTLKFYNDREKAKVGVYKVDSETGNYLAGAVFNLYAADDIYSVDGKLLFAVGELVATSPETGADGYTYFDCDIPIRGEYYGSSIRKDATTNSGNYIVKELRAPLGYYVNEEPMEVTFTYDGQAIMVLDNTCSNKPTEMWVSKRDLTNDEELPGATLAIKDMDGNIVTTWVSTDEPHRVTGLHFGESYTLTEIRAADGYALADNITFRLIQKTDEGGNPLEECEVYYLTTKNILFWKWDDWRLLDDATVIMRDDITKVQISKKDLTTKEELPGAELTLTDEKGNEIDRWVSTDAPHYMERLPAGKYTLTEVTAPDGYAIAERVEFEVLPTGEVQTFEMFDDTIKVKISKVDITTNEELPGAELVIKDKDGTEIDRWISTNEPHYVEKMPAGDYTLTEITAPNGYKVAESIDFTVLPTGEMQTVVMKDAREDTPTPTPDNTPTPDHTPQPTPNTTPAPAAPTATPTPLLTIPKTGDNSPLGLLLAIAGISLAGLAVLVHKNARRKDIAPRDDDDEDTED